MFTKTPFALALLAVLAGCPGVDTDAVVGEWESADPINGEHNSLEIEEDLEGTATIYFTLDGGFYYADFDVVADPDGGDEYTLRFDCDGNCAELDFEASCEVDGGEMECEGDGIWRDYSFEWRLR